MLCRSIAALAALATSVVPQDAAAPRATLSPATGTAGVDPSLTEISIAFDRDMDTKLGWSICGGGVTFPKVGKPAWRDARTLVVPVELTPLNAYRLELNCQGSAQRIVAADGKKLAPTLWTFTTGPAAPGAMPDASPEQRAANTAAADALLRLVQTE
jgi:hypothetical protein